MGQNLPGIALTGHKPQNLVPLIFRQTHIFPQQLQYFLRPNFIQLIHCTHNVPGFFRQSHALIEAGEQLAVVHAYEETL